MKFFFKILLVVLISICSNAKEIKFKKLKIDKNPPYLQPIYDPINRIKLIRITNYKAFENSYPKHTYSKNQPFNCDSSLIKLQTKWLLDGKNYKIIKKFPKELHYTTSIWSHIEPYKLFIFRDDGKISEYNLKTEKQKLLLHIKGFERVTLGPGEGNISLNDRYAVLACKKKKDLYIILIDLKKRKIIKQKVFKNKWGNSYNPKYFDWISISPSGKYIIILWNKKKKNKFVSSNVSLYDKNLTFIRNLYNYGNHGDICFDEKGNEMYVQFAGKGSLNGYYLDKNESIILYKNSELEIGSARHISCRNYKEKGWCIINTEQKGLILKIKLDGSKKYKYIISHHSSQKNYKKSSMAVSNPTGKKIIFSSDWGNKNEKVVYEYVVGL